MNTSNIQTYVKSKLEECNLARLRECSDGSGIPYNTLIRLKYNNVNPRIETIEPIYAFFKSLEGKQ